MKTAKMFIVAVLELGLLAGSARADIYLYSGSNTNVTLNPGTYIITAYGAAGGDAAEIGGRGAKMSAEFSFSAPTTLTLLVGLSGDPADTVYNGNGGGGGGGSFVVQGSTPLLVAGGGGGAALGRGGIYVRGGNGTVTPNGSAGGGNGSAGRGNAGGSGGNGGGGGGGGDPSLTGFGNFGEGAAGGGGFYTDGTSGRAVFGYAPREGNGAGGAAVAPTLTGIRALTPGGYGGLSFLDGGAGGLSNFGIADLASGDGGFGGGGGGYSDNNYGFGGGGGGYSGGGGGGSSDFTTLAGAGAGPFNSQPYPRIRANASPG